MKKLLVLLCGLALIFTLFTAPAAATPIADLTALARYFPEETAVFVSFRTDDDFIDALDRLAARLAEYIPDIDVGEGLRASLDDMVSLMSGGGDFDTAIRSWLGNNGAFALRSFTELMDDKPENDDTVEFALAFEVTDRTAAETFIRNAMATGGVDEGYDITSSQEAYTLFEPQQQTGDEPFVYIGEDVLMFSNKRAALPLTGAPAAPLSASADFANTLGLLPAADYNATVYINMRPLFSTLMTQFASLGEMAGLEQIMGAGLEYIGGQAWGFTLLDERSLVMDITQQVDEGYLQVVGTPVYAPVDPAFAQLIPAGTPLVIHGTDLGGILRNVMQQSMNMSTLWMIGSTTTFPSSQSQQVTPTPQIDPMTQMNMALRGVLGLEIEEVIGWMSGDFALTLGLSPIVSDLRSPEDLDRLPLDFSILIEATDPAAAARLIEALSELYDTFSGTTGTTVTRETIGGVEALVLTIAPTRDIPFPVELVLASNDQIFALGTRRPVIFALEGGSNNLTGDAPFNEAAQYLLPDPIVIFYAAGAGLQGLVDLVELTDPSEAENVQRFVTLLSSASVSATMTEEGDSAVRLVFTIP